MVKAQVAKSKPHLPFFLWRSSLAYDAGSRNKQDAVKRLPEHILFFMWEVGVDPTVAAVADAIISRDLPEFYLENPFKSIA